MTKAHSTIPLDTHQVLQKIIDFTLLRWEGVDNNTLTNILTEAYEAGLNAAEIWFDQDTFNGKWETIQDIRLNADMWKTISPSNASNFITLIHNSYDAIHSLGGWSFLLS